MSATSMKRMIKDKLSKLQDEHEWEDDEMSEEIEIKPKKQKVEGISMTKIKKPNTKRDIVSTTIYIGHLPKLFEEKELRKFLSQFGDIEGIHVSRSYKTGHTRGYAFVKFDSKNLEESSKVASIVAETLNGYLLGTKRLVCDLIPPNQHLKMFRRKMRIVTPQAALRRNLRKVKQLEEVFWSDDRRDRRVKNMLKRDHAKRKQLHTLGIHYDLPPIVHYSNKNNDQTTPNKKPTPTSKKTDSVSKSDKKASDTTNEKKQDLKDVTLKSNKKADLATPNKNPKTNSVSDTPNDTPKQKHKNVATTLKSKDNKEVKTSDTPKSKKQHKRKSC